MRDFVGYALLIGVLALWPVLAAAIPVRVVAPDGYLHRGVTSRLLIAAVNEWGNPIASTPLITATGGAIRQAIEQDPREGVFAYQVTPGLDAEAVSIQVRFGDQSYDAEVEVVQPLTSRLILPKRIAGRAGGGEVKFDVTGDDIPPPEALQVVAGEGTVSSVEAVEKGLQVVIEDYVHNGAIKLSLVIITRLGCALAALIGVFSVLRIAFGG